MKTLFLTIALIGAGISQIIAQNNAPVAVSDSIDVLEQVPVLIDAKANDYDPDGDDFFLAMINPLLGDANIENEMIRYKSSAYNGEDYIRYTIRDNQTPPLSSAPAMIKVNVLFNPDVPVAVADTFELMQLLPHNINLVANDYDANGDILKIGAITAQSNCTVLINPDSLSVTITSWLHPLSTFDYYVRESNTETAYRSRRVKVRVLNTPNPDMPVVMPDTAYTTGGIGITIPVMENDYDPQGDLIEIKTFTQPKHGTVEKIGDSLRYLPELSYAGADEFEYCIREKIETGIYTANAKVKIYVSKNPNCPVGLPDIASGTTAIPMIIDVLPNDYDINGDSLIIKDVSTGTITADNKILYQSSPLTLGQDSITYRVMEAGNPASFSEWTKVNIQLAVNHDLPVAVSDYATTHAGIPIAIRPLLNDILNAEDTLILRSTGVSSGSIHQGIAYLTNDTVIYVPAFQAEGTEVVNYFIRGRESTFPIAIGKIYVNIIKQPYYDSLVINNINAGVNADGALFSKIMRLPGGISGNIYDDERPSHYRFPHDATTNTIFSTILWIAGKGENDTLHMFADMYSAEGLELQSGPVSNTYDTSYYLKFGRTWKINKAQIDYHKQNYSMQGYVPTEAISLWPGNGNPALGEAAQLAPYYDQNNDGLYNCMDGDYPLIRGDETIFYIFNDDVHGAINNALPMKVEVHAMVYGFNTPNDTALYNTVFVHYDIFNRSANTYHNCFIGLNTDIDIGFETDDFIACDVSRSTYYGYNAYEFDGNGQFWAYGDNPPTQAVTILSGPYMDEDGIDNPAGGCDESVNGLNFENDIVDDERLGLSVFSTLDLYFDFGIIEPPTLGAYHYYNFMNGLWNDGTNIMYGGGGRYELGAVGPECRFFYPGDSDPLNWGTSCNLPEGGYNQGSRFWTEEEAGNKPEDKRGVGSMGPFTFHPGQMQEVDIAYVTGQGNAGVASSLRQMFRNIDSLRYAVALGQLIVPSNELGIKPGDATGSVIIYPNPASGLITIKGLPPFSSAEYAVYNLQGLRVAEGKLLAGSRPEIGVSQLTRGMYVVRITTGKAVFSGKFIRN